MTLISCFLPWYGINSRVINEWWNAFNSIGSVAGYALLTFSLLSMAVVLLPVFKEDFDLQSRLPFRVSALLIFFSSQSLFVTLMFIPVYAQYSLLNATNSSTRFGIYLALISSAVASMFALSAARKESSESSASEEFINVPRAHRSVSPWEEEPSEMVEQSPPEEIQPRETEQETEQETIFNHHENRY